MATQEQWAAIEELTKTRAQFVRDIAACLLDLKEALTSHEERWPENGHDPDLPGTRTTAVEEEKAVLTQQCFRSATGDHRWERLADYDFWTRDFGDRLSETQRTRTKQRDWEWCPACSHMRYNPVS